MQQYHRYADNENTRAYEEDRTVSAVDPVERRGKYEDGCDAEYTQHRPCRLVGQAEGGSLQRETESKAAVGNHQCKRRDIGDDERRSFDDLPVICGIVDFPRFDLVCRLLLEKKKATGGGDQR